MSLTEKEAKQRKCPFTLNVPASSAQGKGEYDCCGSECMAWEWDFRGGQEIFCPEENRDNWTGYCHMIFRQRGGAA